jgi:hypothetical protein
LEEAYKVRGGRDLKKGGTIPSNVMKHKQGNPYPHMKEHYSADLVFTHPPFLNLQNLDIIIHNVHVRYEDDQFVLKEPIACGLLLNVFFSLCTNLSFIFKGNNPS